MTTEEMCKQLSLAVQAACEAAGMKLKDSSVQNYMWSGVINGQPCEVLFSQQVKSGNDRWSRRRNTGKYFASVRCGYLVRSQPVRAAKDGVTFNYDRMAQVVLTKCKEAIRAREAIDAKNYVASKAKLIESEIRKSSPEGWRVAVSPSGSGFTMTVEHCTEEQVKLFSSWILQSLALCKV